MRLPVRLSLLSVSLFVGLGVVFGGSAALAQSRYHGADGARILANPAFQAASASLEGQHGRIVDGGIVLTTAGME